MFGIELTPNLWFTSSVTYTGDGRAEFAQPAGVRSGPGSASYDEYEESVDIDDAGFEPAEAPLLGTDQPNSEQVLEHTESSSSLPLQSMGINPCTHLYISTSDGLFSATDGVPYALNNNRRQYRPWHAQFDVHTAQPAAYWVLPLTNFISEFSEAHPELDRHPLRIYPTPDIPTDLPANEQYAATSYANSKNRLIIFELEGTLGFIEPLPDYEERKEQLLKRRERHAVTAVMVGSVGAHSIDDAALDDWFPFTFLRLLGVASGSAIGAPWIEFRDAAGHLVRRVHRHLGRPAFSKGRAVISEKRHHGIEQLLTQASLSPYFRQDRLRVPLKHLVGAGNQNNTLEERLMYLFRALEGLCRSHGLSEQNSMDGLDTPQQQNVQAVLDQAAAQIRALRDGAGSHTQRSNLERIMQRTQLAPQKERHFGIAVGKLLDLYALPDADIVNAHYQQHPRNDGRKTWSSVLSAYRGAAIHESFFDFDGGHYDADDTIIILNHVHDLVLRIVLRMIGYNGTYQPQTTRYAVAEPIDWVQPSTPARALGYQ